MQKDRQNINELRTHFNAKVSNFCKENNVSFIDNGNIKERYLGMEKLLLNKKGNSLLVKNLANYVKNY